MFKLISVLLLLAQPAFASPPKIWIENSGSFFGGGDVITDGKKRVTQNFFTGYDLADIVLENDNALRAIDLHNTYTTYARITALAFIPVFAATMVFARNDNKTPFFIGLFSSVGLLGGWGYLENLSRSYLYQAINTFNGVDMTPPKTVSLQYPVLTF